MPASPRFLLGFLVLLLALGASPPTARGQSAAPAPAPFDVTAAPAVLVMIRDPGCPYCVRFEREAAPGYSASEDGKLAPLVRRYRHDADIAFIPRVVYSPTFVMLVRGREIGRIVGYGGSDIFWMQIAGLMDEVRAALGRSALPAGVEVVDVGTETPAKLH
jgi:hypothetical protein